MHSDWPSSCSPMRPTSTCTVRPRPSCSPDPAGLAAWVLQDQPAWGREAIESAMAATASRRALLTRPMPVVVFYTTAVAAPDGTIRFYDDVYGHDRELVEALRAAAEAP